MAYDATPADAPATVRSLIDAMEHIAPTRFAEAWDNVGLLVGRETAPLRKGVLLTIDLSEAVVEEARSYGVGAIVAYHPPVFKPIQRLTAADALQSAVLGAAEAGIAIYSPHSALDAAPGGLNDWLVRGLAGGSATDEHAQPGDVRALEPWSPDSEARVKIVTFAPEKDAEKLRHALASAGAGRIGDYELCSFESTGTGTFMGGPGTRPTVGEPGRLERAPEVRLEMVCPERALALAIETLREFHPYEEPAFDVLRLVPHAERHTGPGRRTILDRPATVPVLIDRLKAFLGIGAVKVATPWDDEGREVSCVGVCAGAGESLAPAARREGCEVFVTGEMRHHEVLAATRSGMGVILCGHTHTERGYLPTLAERLRPSLKGCELVVSRVDRSPLEVR